MNIAKIAGFGVGTALGSGFFAKKLSISMNDVDISNPAVRNELNRAWLNDEVPNLDQFVKKEPLDLNRQYLCSDYGSREEDYDNLFLSEYDMDI